MTAPQKIWVIRLMSIPALFLMIINFMGLGIAISRENRGDSFPTISLLSTLLGLVAAGILSRWTLFAPIHRSPRECFWVLGSIVLFDILVYGLAALVFR